MLTRNELTEIAKLRGNGSYYVSLYLNVNPVTNPRGDYTIGFKNMLREAEESLGRDELKKVKKGLDALETFVMGGRREFKKGLAVLSSGDGSFWRDYHFPVPFKHELVVDKTPYIKPLLDVLDNYRRYAALLVDKGSARIFIIQLGQMAEYAEVRTTGIQGKHKKGGWYALSQTHYARHIEHQVSLHLKDVAKRLGAFLKDESIEGLFLGGSDEALSMTREILPRALTEKAVGTFHAGMFEKTSDVFSKIEPVLLEFERKREKETVLELLDRAGDNDCAVTGVSDVLAAVQEGKVRRLVMLRGFKRPGYVCSACRVLSDQKMQACPYCKAPMRDIPHLIDMIAQKAVEQGAAVEVAAESGVLEDVGSIGAFLRF